MLNEQLRILLDTIEVDKELEVVSHVEKNINTRILHCTTL